jgi:exosome complex RNA-binding protein Rrp42 (RNase PH superfamily)
VQAAPSTERQSEGLFQLNFELEPTSSSDFETGRAADVALELGRLLERGLKQSGAAAAPPASSLRSASSLACRRG